MYESPAPVNAKFYLASEMPEESLEVGDKIILWIPVRNSELLFIFASFKGLSSFVNVVVVEFGSRRGASSGGGADRQQLADRAGRLQRAGQDGENLEALSTRQQQQQQQQLVQQLLGGEEVVRVGGRISFATREGLQTHRRKG